MSGGVAPYESSRPNVFLGLLDEPHVFYDHTLVHRLAHIVDRQTRDAHRGEGLHLDAGPVGGVGGGDDPDPVPPDLELQVHGGQVQAVTEGDNLWGLLVLHDAGDPGRVQRVALGQRSLPQKLHGLRGHAHVPPGYSGAPHHRLLPHVDHSCRAFAVQMRKVHRNLQARRLKIAECGGIEPPRPYHGRKPVLKTGRATRPTHSGFCGPDRVYYIALRWRRVRTLKSPVRLVTPAASEYSSQAWAYLRLVPRSSRNRPSEISPCSRQTAFILSKTSSAASLAAKSEPPSSTTSPRFKSNRNAGVGSVAGGSGPAARNPSSNLSASRSSSGGTPPTPARPMPVSVTRSPSISGCASRALPSRDESPVAVRASATLGSRLSGRSPARRFRASSRRSRAAATSSTRAWSSCPTVSTSGLSSTARETWSGGMARRSESSSVVIPSPGLRARASGTDSFASPLSRALSQVGSGRRPGGAGSRTVPPPTVTCGASERSTKRSPGSATIGSASLRRARVLSPGRSSSLPVRRTRTLVERVPWCRRARTPWARGFAPSKSRMRTSRSQLAGTGLESRTSPLHSVPVTTTPIPLSTNERSTGSRARPSRRRLAGPAARASSASSRSSTPSPVTPLTGTTGAAMPKDSKRSSTSSAASSAVSPSTASIFERATTPCSIPSTRRTSRCSRVWGITPSSAATTSRKASTPVAPETMFFTKRSWPGTSTRLARRPLGRSSSAYPGTMEMPLRCSSSNRSVSVPVM